MKNKLSSSQIYYINRNHQTKVIEYFMKKNRNIYINNSTLLCPQKDAILTFRGVKWFEVWPKLYKEALTFMIQNKYH
jgi:hypothetical protein